MTETALVAIAGGLWLLAACAGLLPARTASVWASAACSGLGGVAGLCAGVAMMLAPHTVSATIGGNAVVGTVTLRLNSLAGVFVALLGLVAIGLAAYAPRYHQPGRGTAAYLAAYNLAVFASLILLLASTVTVFLVAWESMALLSYLLVLRHHRKQGVATGAFWFLALSEAGFVLIVAAFVWLATATGSTDFATMAARSQGIPSATRGAVYVLALLGFGFKAGLVPLHVWLPEAHPVAPADGSGFLSGLIVKLGVYGVLLFAFDLLGTGPAWWGLLTMGLGALTAVLGILYALAERELKRFLAYSTIENIGVIVTAVGASMVFGSYGQRPLSAFLLVAALYHTANHGAYKTLLFCEVGVIEHATGTRDMDRLGGLVHRLPRTAVITLIGTLGIAALPPLNGFVSEWLVFQGLFQGFRIPSHLIGILIVVAAAALGLTGGLAINAFVRSYGIPFLGMPRTREAAQASERGQPVLGPALLAAACVALSIGAPLVMTALARTVRHYVDIDLRPVLLPGNLTIIPAHADFAAFSPT
ncbi:MAG: proton-conducting transporter membrane subunit, partial [Sciscionella sp.]